MPIKTFSQAEQLTAADTNTYLNNGGLVYITQATGTSTTALNVNNCFSATYDNYRIVISNATADSARGCYLRMRSSGTDSTASYYYGARYVLFAGGGADNNGNNIGFFPVATLGASVKSGNSLDITNPFDTVHTTIMGVGANFDASWHYAGVHQVNTSYDGFTLFPSGGNMTLTVRVYGYREA